MSLAWIGIAAISAAALGAGPALANDKAPMDKSAARAATAGSVRLVRPGDEIGIACAALDDSVSVNDVRVVLTLAPAPLEAATPGYRKVLATDEHLAKGAVHVRVPSVPDLANRVVAVSVYVVKADGARNCEAGQLRIAERSNHAKGKQS